MTLTVTHIPTGTSWQIDASELVPLLESRPDSVWRVWPNGDQVCEGVSPAGTAPGESVPPPGTPDAPLRGADPLDRPGKRLALSFMDVWPTAPDEAKRALVARLVRKHGDTATVREWVADMSR